MTFQIANKQKKNCRLKKMMFCFYTVQKKINFNNLKAKFINVILRQALPHQKRKMKNMVINLWMQVMYILNTETMKLSGLQITSSFLIVLATMVLYIIPENILPNLYRARERCNIPATGNI